MSGDPGTPPRDGLLLHLQCLGAFGDHDRGGEREHWPGFTNRGIFRLAEVYLNSCNTFDRPSFDCTTRSFDCTTPQRPRAGLEDLRAGPGNACLLLLFLASGPPGPECFQDSSIQLYVEFFEGVGLAAPVIWKIAELPVYT